MIIDTDKLRKDIQDTIDAIEKATNMAQEEADRLGCDVYDLRTPDGKWVMNELIASKIKAHNSLLMVEFLDPGVKS